MRFIFWMLIGYIIYRIIKGYAKEKQVESETAAPPGDATYQDPVCGVYVAEYDAVVGRLNGKRIHFCSMECLEKYQQQVAEK